MNLNPQQQAQIQAWRLAIPKHRAIIKLKEAVIEAREAENLAHRNYVAVNSFSSPDSAAVLSYCATLRSVWHAEKDLLQLEVFELKAQLDTMEKMVKEADSPITRVGS